MRERERKFYVLSRDVYDCLPCYDNYSVHDSFLLYHYRYRDSSFPLFCNFVKKRERNDAEERWKNVCLFIPFTMYFVFCTYTHAHITHTHTPHTHTHAHTHTHTHTHTYRHLHVKAWHEKCEMNRDSARLYAHLHRREIADGK